MTDSRITPDPTLVAQLRMTALAQAVSAKAAKDTDEVVVARAARYLAFLVEGQPAVGDGTGKPEKPAEPAKAAPAPKAPVAVTAASVSPAAPVTPAPAVAAAAAAAPGTETVPPPVTKEQTIAALKALMAQNFAGAQEVLGQFQATQLSQIPQARWAEVVRACQNWKPKEQPKPADAAAALLA